MGDPPSETQYLAIGWHFFDVAQGFNHFGDLYVCWVLAPVSKIDADVHSSCACLLSFKA